MSYVWKANTWGETKQNKNKTIKQPWHINRNYYIWKESIQHIKIHNLNNICRTIKIHMMFKLYTQTILKIGLFSCHFIFHYFISFHFAFCFVLFVSFLNLFFLSIYFHFCLFLFLSFIWVLFYFIFFKFYHYQFILNIYGLVFPSFISRFFSFCFTFVS